MKRKITRYWAAESESECRERVRREIDDFTWIDAARRAEIVEQAKVERSETKYGPTFVVTYMSE